MEKISSILPSNKRIKSVDFDEAHPIRPGVPSFGRPVGPSSVSDRVSLSGGTPGKALKETLTYRNPKEAQHSKMVEAMTNKFFDTRLKSETKPEIEPEIKNAASSFKSFEPSYESLEPLRESSAQAEVSEIS